MLYHESDLANHFRMHQSAKLNMKQIDQVWRAIKNLTKVRSSINKSALEIAKEAEDSGGGNEDDDDDRPAKGGKAAGASASAPDNDTGESRSKLELKPAAGLTALKMVSAPASAATRRSARMG